MSLFGVMADKGRGEIVKKEDVTPEVPVALLEQIENLPCPFERINHLKELKNITGVSLVVVTNNEQFTEILKDSIDRINAQFHTFFGQSSDDPKYRRRILNETELVLSKRRQWAQERLGNNNEVPLLGLYSRKLLWFEDAEPIVYLFADNINEYAFLTDTNVNHVYAYVFIHEMMHAYYDAFYSKGFPSREPLEEAFAEYGMLTFINKNSSSLPKDLLEDAIKHVRSKISTRLTEYGFGYDLYRITGGGDAGMISRYMEISNKIDLEVIKNWKSNNKYFEDIKQYPNPIDADKCFKGVQEILARDWPKPAFTIQPMIRGSLVSSPGPKRALPSLHATKEWAVTATQMGWHDQYPLIRANDLVKLLEEILKVMKKEGIESSLSFKGDQIVFLGRPFSHFTTVSRHLISESLCVEGTTVFPDFIPNIWGAPGKIGNILHALSVLLNGTFSLVHKGSDFVLYGPDMCASLFSVPALPTAVPPSTPIKERTKYDIKDKSTSKVLWENLSMRDAVLFIIKDYCSKDPTINYFDLQKLFGGISTHLPQTLNNIEIEGNAKAYYDGVNADDSGNRRYFYNEPITLSSGEVILITTQWSSKDNFNEFRKVADDLGYIIIEAMV